MPKYLHLLALLCMKCSVLDVCSVKLDCQNGGYTDPKDCSKCRCPPKWGGKLCNQYNTEGSPGELNQYHAQNTPLRINYVSYTMLTIIPSIVN